MTAPARPSFTAEGLPREEISALKERERRNRDIGAGEYLAQVAAERGAYNLAAESRALLHHIAPESGEAVLDAGSGVGRLALPVASRAARVVCVDLSASALAVLRERAESRGLGNVETVEADLCGIPAGLGPFDRAYAVEVLQHVPSAAERRAAVARLHDLLKPGGHCLVSTVCWNRRNRRAGTEKEGFWGAGERGLYVYAFAPRELGRLLAEVGFRDVRLRGLLVLPGRLTRHLPPSFAGLETWCSRVPALAGAGRYVVAMSRRR